MSDPDRRRRRLRRPPTGGGERRTANPRIDEPGDDLPARPADGPGTAKDDREAERGLRGLVGAGSSQLSVGAALRTRDASRPTEADLAEAEEQLVLVRRNWVPRETPR